MGYLGRFGNLELLQQHYWWLGMSIFVKNYVKGYTTCQQTKVNTYPTVPPLMPIPALPKANPFKVATVDFIMDLPPSGGWDAIMVVADHNAMKGMVLCPTNKTVNATGTTLLYHQHVYKHLSLPTCIISDCRLQFTAKVFQELTHLVGCKSALSMAYHPQTDGGMEQMNQEIEAYL